MPDKSEKILNWCQPETKKRYYELKSEEKKYAQIVFDKKFFGFKAVASFNEKNLEIEIQKSLSPKIFAKSAESSMLISKSWFSKKWIIEIDSDKKYFFYFKNYFSGIFFLEDSKNKIIATTAYKKQKLSGLFKTEATITTNVELSDTMLSLLSVAWFIVLFIRRPVGSDVAACAIT